MKQLQSPQPPRTPEQGVFLNLQKTADLLMAELAAVLKSGELSPTQYNVLRILRAAGAGGLPCGRISERMLTREPDMTRLLDRLETRGLIARSRSTEDRRVVRGTITEKGLGVLTELDEPVAGLHRRQLGHLGREKLRQLTDLLEQARERTV